MVANTNGDGGNNGNARSLRRSILTLRLLSNDGLLLVPSNLEPDVTYEIESSAALTVFSNNQRFGGSELMVCNFVSKNLKQKYFRIRQVP